MTKIEFKHLKTGYKFLRETDVDGCESMKIPLSYARGFGKFNAVTAAWGGEDEPMNYPFFIEDDEMVYPFAHEGTKIVKFKNSDYSSRTSYDESK